MSSLSIDRFARYNVLALTKSRHTSRNPESVTREEQVDQMIEESRSPIGTVASTRTYYDEISPEYFKRVGASDDLFTKVRGAIALLLLWTVWLSGSFWLIWWSYLAIKGYYTAAGIAAAVIAYPYIVEVKQSPAFIRFILSGAGWFRGGTCLYIEDSVKTIDASQNVLLCQHPHGLFSFGFLQNGSAARINARKPELYVPDAYAHLKPNGLALIEPLLFQVPLIKHFVEAFGCAKPATRKWTKKLMNERTPLGLLPGGSEEIIISKHGHERVWVKNRKGFIKYALQNGYTLLIGYTYGESDSYRTSDFGQKTRLWILKKFKAPVFFAWGTWWCPLLPRSEVPLETVIGNPIRLPKVENPTDEEINKWHALYIEKLIDLFDRNKAKFGYGDRRLELY